MLNTLYERILAEYKRLNSKIKSIDLKLKTYPQSDFYCTITRGKYYKWYKVDNNKSEYLPKSKRQLAEKLAVRKYLLLLKKDLIQERKAIQFYLKHHHSDAGESEQLLENPAYQELLNPYFKPISQELIDWANAPYEKNSSYPEQLIHKTASGNIVRSKSEAIIDLFLYTNKIPFRYECPLQLGQTTIHPEFTIRHPKTGEIFYWEHFGMMDDPLYCKKFYYRIKLYISHGIFPSIKLITTFETKNNPLTTEMVERIIEQYFL